MPILKPEEVAQAKNNMQNMGSQAMQSGGMQPQGMQSGGMQPQGGMVKQSDVIEAKNEMQKSQ